MVNVDCLSGFPRQVAQEIAGEHGSIGAICGPLALVKIDGVHQVHANVLGEVGNLRGEKESKWLAAS